MTALWLLIPASVTVVSASSSIVVGVLPNVQHALWTNIVSYILFDMVIPLVRSMLVLYLHSLTVYRLPPYEVIVSVFLPLGPLGQSGFAIMELRKVASKVFRVTGGVNTPTTDADHFLYIIGFLAAIAMWGYALI